MDGILIWVTAGAAGLFFLAVVVAWWEHLGRRAAPPEALPTAAPRPVSVDVNLDALPPRGDSGARREVLDDAIARMTQPGALQESRRSWVDTTPMVGPGARSPSSEAAPSQHG